MVEQAGSGSGDALPDPADGAGQFPVSFGAAPARVVRSQRTRAASGLRPEVLWPPARSWLTWMFGPSPLRTLAPGMGQIPGPGLQGD